MLKKIFLFFILLSLVAFFSGLSGITPVSAKDDLKLKVFVHYPNPHGKPVVDPCAVTSNDQVNDWLYAGWQMPSSGVSYKISYGTKPKNLSDGQVYSAIDSSFDTWAAADSDQIFNYNGSTSVKSAKYDRINAILWKGMNSTAIAITYVWYYSSNGLLAEADTAFNKNLKWSYTAYDGTNDCGGMVGTFDLQNIGTHEFGHWVGLDDLYSSTDKDLTMYGYGDTQELKKDSLGLGDITGANSIAP